MSATPTLDDAHEHFDLPIDDTPLSDLAERADFDFMHFFLRDALAHDQIGDSPHSHHRFALIPYSHPNDALDDQTFQLIADAGYRPASLRALLTLAIERPQLQTEADVIALGTLRTRRIFDGDGQPQPGETVWDQTRLDPSICQWGVGLSRIDNRRALVPMELFLDDLIGDPTYLLVVAPNH